MARVFSGIQPSGELYIGNYLGAVQNWVKLQHQHDCLFSVVDLHAITQAYDPASLSQRTVDMAVGLYAAGLDPERAIVFVQSHVPEHTELNWLLNTVTPLGELERQTQFKDKAQRQESVPAGTLSWRCALSLNCVWRSSSPSGVTVLSSQLSSACSGTCDCTNTIARSGSRPDANGLIAMSSVRWERLAASYAWVIACRSTTQNRQSCCCCSLTQFWTAPR